jgi:hypothetical protein
LSIKFKEEREVIKMKKFAMVAVALLLAASICYAAEEVTPKATEPVGAVVETGGILVGKITNVIEKSLGGGKKADSLVLAEDNGTTKIIPLDNTVKCLDSAFNILTLNQLKGKKVSVEVSKDSGKATKVQEVK